MQRRRAQPDAPRVLVLSLFLVAVVGSAPTRGTPLDPSHPVWSGAHASQWSRALSALGAGRPRLRRPAVSAAKSLTAAGTRVLVVPVTFAGAPSPQRSREDLEEAWFGEGEGSVRGYWEFVSGGALRLRGRVLPWMTIDGALATDYLNVRDGAPVVNLTAGPRRLARAAAAAAAGALGSLAAFDDDGPDGRAGSGDDDGIVDLLVVVFPGAGWESTMLADGPAILSLQSRLGGETVVGTDASIDVFTVVGEEGPLGVWVHEFGHLLGLEDLYDLDFVETDAGAGRGSASGGLGIWSLMASGTWAGGGTRPSALDAVSRLALDFGRRTEVETAVTRILPPLGPDGGESLVLHPLGEWEGESFVCENRRRREGAVVDGALPGSGILVYRVDDRFSTVRSSVGRWIELLQADGLDALGRGQDDGDGGDPFDGAPGRDRLDGSTNPSTQSARPSPLRTPPILRITAADADQAQRIDFELADGAALRLQAAWVGADEPARRSYLGFGRREALHLRWEDVGSEATTAGQLEIALDARSRPVVLHATPPVDLVAVAGGFENARAIELEDTLGAVDRRPVLLNLRWIVDGGAARSLQLGIPVSAFGGLSRGALLDFVPSHVSGVDSTVFVPMDVRDLPAPADYGWELRTGGLRRYADGIDVALTGPWMAAPSDRRLDLYSAHETEASLPGQAFDGGVLEVYLPDHGWRPLRPEGDSVVHLVRRSTAAVHDRWGFGGDSAGWSGAFASLPEVDLPLRVRLRFASDGSGNGRGWAVAGLRTDDDAAHFEIRITPRAPDGFLAELEPQGTFRSITGLRLWWSPPGQEDWSPASVVFSPQPGATVRIPLSVPEEIRRARIAVFAEPFGPGPSGLRLGEGGLLREPTTARLRVLGTPGPGPFLFSVDAAAVERLLLVFDLRGRRVAGVTVPAGSDWIEWDGTDDAGSRVASAPYVVRLIAGPTVVQRRIVLVR